MLSDVEVGTALPEQVFRVTRRDLVRYAGASGDDNVIHWDERVAKAVGLPDVIAHGMLTMAKAVQVVTAWAGDPSRVESYGVRFSRPVVVPGDDAGTELVVGGTVEELLEDGRVRVVLDARVGEDKVLMRAGAVVRLDA